MSGPSNDSPHQLEVDVFSVVAEDDYLGDSVTMEHTHGLLTTPWVITGHIAHGGSGSRVEQLETSPTSTKRLLLETINREWVRPVAALGGYRRRGINVRPIEAVSVRFRQLADRWDADTAFSSSAHEFVAHPAYLEVIGMGLQVLPFLFERLPSKPAPWFPALRAIVGEDVADGAETAEAAMRAWLEWGLARGYAR